VNGDGHNPAIRVLLADEDDALREDLRERLASDSGIEVVASAADGERAHRLATQLQPDVAILSASLPRLDGIAAAESIGVAVPFCQVIVLSHQNDVTAMRRAMSAGAREFLVKPVDGYDLIAAIYRVYNLEAKRRTGRPGTAEADESGMPNQRARTGRVIAVWGPKGGVGRTFLAVNLAAAFAGPLKQRTLLIDGSLHFGSVDVALNITSTKRTILDLIVKSDEELDPDLVERVVTHHPSGIDVLPAPPAETLLLVSAIHVQRILAVARCLYQTIIVDTHPSLDETTLAFLDLSDQIVTMATPELTALRNLRVFLGAAGRLGYGADKICLVINRADMRDAVPLAEIEAACRRPIAVSLPNDHEMVSGSINAGAPLVLQQPDRPLSKQTVHLAHLLAGDDRETDAAKATARPKGLGRLFGR
jgi:pilus assembly protein CpaE